MAYVLIFIEFICNTVYLDLMFGFGIREFRINRLMVRVGGLEGWGGCGWGWLPRLQFGWEALILVV